MGVWGQAPSINLAYYQESKFGIAAVLILNVDPKSEPLYYHD
jgi:hypothetical protein